MYSIAACNSFFTVKAGLTTALTRFNMWRIMHNSDVSSAGIPYVMTINNVNTNGKMLVIKTNAQWTFSRFDEQNATMLNTPKEIYPSLKFNQP